MIAEQVEQYRPVIGTPSLEDVRGFFVAQDYPFEEGEVFFYYYQALGWRSETGIPIRDWKSAASRWLWNLEN
ncbi:hypothetical protein [Algoriphagus litoralis]|uniref:hypothetical protein n=1 Tax=Algoriphagus litoralis TaxID=2202829 RepID=UPI000DBA4EA8|nr:hypothetical protein [Algoriphagus litoralis]